MPIKGLTVFLGSDPAQHKDSAISVSRRGAVNEGERLTLVDQQERICIPL
jgi:hypothetical protein